MITKRKANNVGCDQSMTYLTISVLSSEVHVITYSKLSFFLGTI